MTSSPTTRNRLNKQGTGDNSNTWGEKLNSEVFDLLDTALDGWTTKALTGDVSLTSSNYVADEARSRVLNFTGTGAFTVTVPAVEKAYLVRNACTGNLTIASSGGGDSAVLASGEVVFVITNGTHVYRETVKRMLAALDMGGFKITSLGTPSASTDAATKGYVDSVAFEMAEGELPGQAGNAGKVLGTDGDVAGWEELTGAGLASVADYTVTVTAAAAAEVRAGTDTTKALTAAALAGAAAFITLTDAATVAWDASQGFNATVTLGGNRTIGAPTNLMDGLTYCLELVQDATGSRVPTWNSTWDFGLAGTPVLQTAANKRDRVFAIYRSASGKLHASFNKGA